MSYFSQFRQNIATVDQLLAAGYLKIGLAIFEEALFFSMINNLNIIIEIETFMKISNFLNCIIIPCYWMYSTHRDFTELWSKETVFCRKYVPQSNRVCPLKLNTMYSLDLSHTALEPRRPHILETSFMVEESQTDRSLRLPGRSSYGFKLHKSVKQK